jgi:DNA-binding CsgD family transcriptional regulator
VDIVTTIGRHDTARALLDDLVSALADRDELLESKTLWIRCLIELDAGRWDLARDLAERDREIAALYEASDQWPGPFVVAAQLELHRGELDAAREQAVHARDLATTSPGFMAHAEATLGLVDRAGGDTAAAIARFTTAEAAAEACGWREPSLRWWRAEFAEALLEVGRTDDAVALLDAWEPDARRLGRDRELAHVTRCRGLVAAARGDVDLALTTLEEALDAVDAVGDPVGRARALLALGVTRRRARQKRSAREALEAALAAFEQLGDAPWAARVRAELGKIGGRSREVGLTAAERRVAALVAEGKTNREVAAALVLGERTVETHLTHVYAKLGVRSRTELAHVYEPNA